MTTNTGQSKTAAATEWVTQFHANTGGVWPTPGQVQQHCPAKVGYRTANRAIEKALKSTEGTIPAKSH